MQVYFRDFIILRMQHSCKYCIYVDVYFYTHRRHMLRHINMRIWYNNNMCCVVYWIRVVRDAIPSMFVRFSYHMFTYVCCIPDLITDDYCGYWRYWRITTFQHRALRYSCIRLWQRKPIGWVLVFAFHKTWCVVFGFSQVSSWIKPFVLQLYKCPKCPASINSNLIHTNHCPIQH